MVPPPSGGYSGHDADGKPAVRKGLPPKTPAVALSSGQQQREAQALEAVRALAEQWRYKGEYGWGAWQEGRGPDMEGHILDQCAGELLAAIDAALRCLCNVGVQECPVHPGRLKTKEEKIQFRKDWDAGEDES